MDWSVLKATYLLLIIYCCGANVLHFLIIYCHMYTVQ